MPLVRQLELNFSAIGRSVSTAFGTLAPKVAVVAPPPQLPGRDPELEHRGRELLRLQGAGRIASDLIVEWSSRLRTSAGRADFRQKLITLNPLLRGHGQTEIDTTFLHELAHLLAQFRAGRKRIAPHGPEWRHACNDLGIVGEPRCHTLPFPVRRRARRYIYGCPHCGRRFPRVHRFKRPTACLACCNARNGGRFDRRFRLQLISYRGIAQPTGADDTPTAGPGRSMPDHIP